VCSPEERLTDVGSCAAAGLQCAEAGITAVLAPVLITRMHLTAAGCTGRGQVERVLVGIDTPPVVLHYSNALNKVS
jgi:hypothetical protein